MSKKKIQKPRNLATVIASTTEILQAFGAAVTAFNNLNAAGGVDEFMTLLDPGVLLETINGAVVYPGKPGSKRLSSRSSRAFKASLYSSDSRHAGRYRLDYGYVKGTANYGRYR